MSLVPVATGYIAPPPGDLGRVQIIGLDGHLHATAQIVLDDGHTIELKLGVGVGAGRYGGPVITIDLGKLTEQAHDHANRVKLAHMTRGRP